jgi:uncharacterized membrane-anchored protein YhcB (DUF1043 family)
MAQKKKTQETFFFFKKIKRRFALLSGFFIGPLFRRLSSCVYRAKREKERERERSSFLTGEQQKLESTFKRDSDGLLLTKLFSANQRHTGMTCSRIICRKLYTLTDESKKI